MQTPTPTEQRSPEMLRLLAYINETPELLSLLYDMDLMPEQLTLPSREGNLMILLAVWHRDKKSTLELELAEARRRGDALAQKAESLREIVESRDAFKPGGRGVAVARAQKLGEALAEWRAES